MVSCPLPLVVQGLTEVSNRIGEKLLAWTDVDPPVEKILQLVTLWWLTETFPRSIYPYREVPPPLPPLQDAY